MAASGTRLALSFSPRAGCRSRSSAACGSCRRAAIRWLPRPARRLSGEQRPGRRAPAAADRSPGNGPGSTVTGARVMPIQMRRAPGRRALPGRGRLNKRVGLMVLVPTSAQAPAPSCARRRAAARGDPAAADPAPTRARIPLDDRHLPRRDLIGGDHRRHTRPQSTDDAREHRA